MAPTNRTTYSINGLKRWSCKSKEIPGIADIKAIHVYDFDNTLFSSPLPNPQVWQSPTIGFLQSYDCFATGGWWHDPSVLEATGEGLDKEEPRAWENSWNNSVVDLVKLSMAQKDALNVLLTGRAEGNFADLIQRIVNAKGLDFDLVALKPEVSPQGERFPHTMDFKQSFLKDLIFTYKNAEEIRVYEDRQHHVKGFRDFFERVNKSLLSHPVNEPPPPRRPIIAEVVHVCELKASLDVEVEVEVVQRIINRHNFAITTDGPNPHRAKNKLYAIQQKFIYCGYLINQNDSSRLISLTNCPAHLIDSGEVKLLASSILISPHPPSQQLLQKVGGKGKKVTWQVDGLAKLEDRIWAAKVTPISADAVHTQDATAFVVLALRKGTRPIDAARIQNWNPVAADKAMIFETVVGDKVMLSIEEATDNDQHNGPGRGRYSYNTRNDRVSGGQKRKHTTVGDDEFLGKENFPALGASSNGYHGERDDGSWPPTNQMLSGRQNIAPGDRHGQAKYFNQQKQQVQQQQHPQNDKRSFSGGQRGGRGGGNNEGKGKGKDRQRQNAGGGRNGRGGNRLAGYKSLDDYGPGSFDGPPDLKGAGGNEMVMNY